MVEFKHFVITYANLGLDNLVVSWEASLSQEIPRALFFMENGQDAVVFGLEKGSMCVSIQ